MTTINLRQNQEVESAKISLQGMNKGFFLSIGILVVTVGIFFGLKPYLAFLEKQTLAIEDEIKSENAKIVGLKKLEQIMDIQNRLREIKSNLQISNQAVLRLDMNKVLDNFSADLNPGVVVSDYAYSPDSVAVTFESGNFNDAATQVLNFKKSVSFEEAYLKSIARKEESISSTVVMNIKKAKPESKQ